MEFKKLIEINDNINCLKNEISDMNNSLKIENKKLKDIFENSLIYFILKEEYNHIKIEYIDEDELELILDGKTIIFEDPEKIFKEKKLEIIKGK